MARYTFKGRTRDLEGNVVPNTDITIKIANTDTDATVYTSYTGGTPISVSPQIQSDSRGYFELFIDDNDHSSNTLFDIVSGNITYTYIDIFRRGEDGTSGTSGSSGTSGVDGTSGSSGTSGTSVIGEGVNGSAFITDINPQSTGNVGDKQFSSDGEVLDECTTDTQLVTISVLALPGDTNYKPVVTINENVVTLSASTDAPLFTGTIDIDLNNDEEITVEHEDGAQHTVTIIQDTPPEITSAQFTGGYPGDQTELKESDEFDLNVQSDINIISIEIDDYGAFKSGTYSVSSGINHTITGTIEDRGNTVQNLGAKVRVQKSTGSWSDWYLTENDGSEDSVNLVKLNNLHPSVSIDDITYPGVQEALKDSESATVSNTVTNFDTITYSSPTNELNIDNTSTYESSKSVNRISGNYNINTNNFRITANRSANDATTVSNTIVYIAHESCTIVLSVPYTRLRSGGNDGTSAQDYTVTITSSQNLLSAPTLNAGQGTWQGAGFTGSGTTWTRQIQIHDDDVKGAYSFSNLSSTNLAGTETTVISSGSTYTIGGFVSRDIALDAFENESNMNTESTEYTKVTLSWSFKSSLTNRELLNSDPPVVDGWCLVALNTNPTTIRILDTSATESSSQESTITIEESV